MWSVLPMMYHIIIIIMAISSGHVLGFPSKGRKCTGWKCQSNILSNRFNNYVNSYTAYFTPDENRSCPNTTICKNRTTIPDRVRVNKTFITEFNINVGLDLYMLMDGTVSFEDDRKSLGATFSPFEDFIIANVNSNTQFGFSLFSDKPADDGYGLNNINSLIESTDLLGDIISGVDSVSGAGDVLEYPEDPLTGIHQVAKCVQEIGWRTDTLRMLVVSTDEDYHEPVITTKIFDATKCHLNSRIYNGDAYRLVDYPSVSQVKDAVQDSSIKIIFAIRDNTSAIFKRYEDLAAQLTPPGIVLHLEKESANLKDVIKEAYDIATRTATIETRITGTDYKELLVTTKCGETGRTGFNIHNKDLCAVNSDKQIKFYVQISLLCPRKSVDTSKVEVSIEGHQAWKSIELNDVCK